MTSRTSTDQTNDRGRQVIAVMVVVIVSAAGLFGCSSTPVAPVSPSPAPAAVTSAAPLRQGASPSSTAAAHPVPRIRGKNGSSMNWSGYTVQTNLASPQSGAVSDVIGSWSVPTASATTGNSFSSAWVGIDGYSDGTAEQIGTQQDWYNGVPRYYAVWQMYPKMSRVISAIAVHPGDQMTADVKYAGGGYFVFIITDITTGQSFTTRQQGSAQRSSAEWVMEAPSGRGVLPLAKFGTLGFASGRAILNGHQGPIGDPAWQHAAITMTNGNGTVIATPSSLIATGTAFTVTRN